MKVLASAPRPAQPTTKPFGRLLAEARATLRQPLIPPGLRPRGLTASAVLVQQAVLRQARVESAVEAERLRGVRVEGQEGAQAVSTSRAEQATRHEQGTAERLIELIVRELTAVPAATPPLSPAPFATPSMLVERRPDARAEQAAALIEKIERFVRSQRPGLALTLNNGLAARVELERLGPREVAVKLVGRDGPPAPEVVSRVRDELRARGLKVGALSVA